MKTVLMEGEEYNEYELKYETHSVVHNYLPTFIQS